MSDRCNAKTEVWARVCGFFRPVNQWNLGKKQEYRDRKHYQVDSARLGNVKRCKAECGEDRHGKAKQGKL